MGEETDADGGRSAGHTRREVLAAGGVAAVGTAYPLSRAEHSEAAVAGQAPDKSSTKARVVGSGEIELTLRVNGESRAVKVEPRVSLLDALRERLGMTGTKKGCDHGECGACTVLIEGRRVKSCLTLAIMREDADITTIEGLADGDDLHPVQRAFVERDAFQCGYCTPGQIMSAVGFLREQRFPSTEEIREGMSGNLCRCSAYPNIVAAIRDAAGGDV